MPSNGGVSQLARVSLIPMQRVVDGVTGLYAFDPLFGFNDPLNSSSYSYRVEEILQGRIATIGSLLVSYRDLGIVSVTFSLSGTNDLGQIVNAQTTPGQAGASTTITLGNKTATNKILTKIIGISLTAQNMQLSIFRAAGAGPLSITKLTLCGTVEIGQKFGVG